MDKFVNLHIGTRYSDEQNLCTVEDLIKKAKELNMNVLSKTDWPTNGFNGVKDFYFKCKENNIKAIIGIRATVKEGEEKVFYTLFAKNVNGYRNLEKIFLDKFRPSITDIINNSKDLICLVKVIERYKYETIIEKLKDVFNDNLYLELYGEEKNIKCVREISLKYNIRTVVANAVCFVNKEDVDKYREVKRLYDEKHNFKHFPDEDYEKQLYFKSFDEIKEQYPKDIDSILRTNEVAKKCDLIFEEDAK